MERVIEIEVPGDASIFYYKAGIKSGLESMEQGKRFLTLAGDIESASKVNNAIIALTAFLDIVSDVTTDIITELQEQPEVSAAFMPVVKSVENDG